MPNAIDTVYAPRPWTRRPDWAYLRPWATNEERLTQQAIEVATIPGQQLADQVRPPLDQVQLFRPRLGYRTRALGIDDIIDIDRVDPATRYDYSGTQSGMSGSSRNSFGTGTW